MLPLIILLPALKSIKYFIDSTFRAHVEPILGSVIYCDLWVAAEHSGIYVGDGKISNIVVDNLLMADSTVRSSDPYSFTSKSFLGTKIYVSCNEQGAVGNTLIAQGAKLHVGEKSFYGLVFKNCHQFSEKCVGYANNSMSDESFVERREAFILDSTWAQLYQSPDNSTHKVCGISDLFGRNSIRLGVRRADRERNGLIAVPYIHDRGKFSYTAFKDSTGANVLLTYGVKYFCQIKSIGNAWSITIYQGQKKIAYSIAQINISPIGRRLSGVYIEVGSVGSLWDIRTDIAFVK